MNLRSLIPLRDRGGLARSEASPFGSLQREVDRLFEEFSRGLPMFSPQAMTNILPSIDVTETDKEIEITAELPGLERKDVDISIEDDVLTIRGEKKVESEQGDKKGQQGDKKGNGGDNKSYHVSERSYGVFYRMLQLPPGIDPSTVKATMSNGVLKISIPKPARTQAKKIEVKEAA
jgi:HSP20 family protein